MTRFPDWTRRLEVYVRENARREFVYGVWDCCLFAAGAVEAMTGVDPAGDIRALYQNRTNGLRVLADRGGVEGVCAAHGMPEVAVKLARRGDVVLIEESEGAPLLGIVTLNGREVWVIGHEGLQTIPLGMAVKAWRV